MLWRGEPDSEQAWRREVCSSLSEKKPEKVKQAWLTGSGTDPGEWQEMAGAWAWVVVKLLKPSVYFTSAAPLDLDQGLLSPVWLVAT